MKKVLIPGKASKPVVRNRSLKATIQRKAKELDNKIRIVIPQLKNMVVLADPGCDPEEVRKRYIAQYNANRVGSQKLV